MRRIAPLYLLLAGCVTPGHPIDAEAIAPLVADVCETHDALLRGELVPVPEGQEREQMLRSSQILREVVQEALK